MMSNIQCIQMSDINIWNPCNWIHLYSQENSDIHVIEYTCIQQTSENLATKLLHNGIAPWSSLTFQWVLVKLGDLPGCPACILSLSLCIRCFSVMWPAGCSTMCWFSKLPATNGSAAISATAFMASLGSPVTSVS